MQGSDFSSGSWNQVFGVLNAAVASPADVNPYKPQTLESQHDLLAL